MSDDMRESSSVHLLQRSAPDDYRAEQAAQLAIPLPQNTASESCSVLVFRLCQEWFALPAHLCRQVLKPRAAHTLPHRSNATLLGVVNVRGQMLLKVSLLEVLGTCADRSPVGAGSSLQIYPRMVVMEKAAEDSAAGHSEVWVFEVDELEGIQSIEHSRLERPAAGVVASSKTCTHQVFLWQDRRVNLLDDHRLFEALRRRAL